MRVLASALLLAVAIPVAAQEREIRDANLPRALEWELLRMYDGGARRYDGPATIPASEVVQGDVAVMGGTFRVAGRIEGRLAVVGGDVIMDPGGAVTGDVTIIGGEIRMSETAEVQGTITAYGTSARRYDRRDRRDDDDGWRASRRDRGYSRLTVRAGASYNRVEGLPIMFGPVLETAGPNPLRLEALAIWRSEIGGSLDAERMGYQVEAEQFLGGHRAFSVGASAYSVIHPMDRWQIGDLEASLATALFHEDYRDHFEREGWSAFAKVTPSREVEARVAYRQESYGVVVPGDPWSLFNGGDLWRLQPVIGEGEARLIGGSLELDFRDDEDDPERGWLARVSVDRPVGGTLTRPSLLIDQPGGDLVRPAEALDMDFTTARVDLRRYMPISYESQLAVRLVAGGSLTERSLPSQFQHALGGIGTLPGFSTFSADCGARSTTGRLDGTRLYAGYGCDRFVLGQLEYRGGLALDFGFGDPDHDDDEWWDDVHIDVSPEWVVFFDAGQGWAYSDAPGGAAVDTGMLYDAGVGFLLDDVGFYVALPLNGGVDQDPRFFIRLDRRF